MTNTAELLQDALVGSRDAMSTAADLLEHAGQRSIADRLRRQADECRSALASLSPAATSGSEAGGEAVAGQVTWHSSEEGGGPDVGIEVNLGGGSVLYVGEMAGHDEWQIALIVGNAMASMATVTNADLARSFADDLASRLAKPSSPAGGGVVDSVALSIDSDMRNSDFETWACKRGYLMHLHEGDESRRYRYSLTEEAWLGWCAALESSHDR